MKNNKVTVLLREDEFLRFDAYCSSQGYKKSALVARLIREHLDGEHFDERQTQRRDSGRRRPIASGSPATR